jgi:circadian clock protein KaiB
MKSDFSLRLYVAGDGPNSSRAVSNLNVICQEYLANRHKIEIVDVLREPKRALTDGIMMTPTLIRLSPTPAVQIIGDLSDRVFTLQTLGLPLTSHV